jgi:hypothetical protein
MVIIILLLHHGVEFAGVVAGTTSDTFIGNDVMRSFDFAHYGSGRTDFGTHGATDAFFGIDAEVEELVTGTGRAFSVKHMSFVFITEKAQGRKNRVWSSLAKAAETGVANDFSKSFHVHY